MSRKDQPEAEPALVLVDKPEGWTSHGVVARVRKLAGTRKVGHAGTLDPMATGVLVLGVGRATRLLAFLVGADKEYTATIRLGQARDTDDAQGEVVSALGAKDVADEAIAAGVADLTGDIEQVPSTISALKVDGQRAHARARAGEDVVLAARPVTVRRFEVLARRDHEVDGLAVVDLDVVVECTSGTYVRALARDLGATLGTGGHLTALRRTRVGPYDLSDTRPLADLEADFAATPVALAARKAFPVRELTEDETALLKHGRRLSVTGLGEGPIGAFAPDGTLVALLSESGGAARPLLVLAPA